MLSEFSNAVVSLEPASRATNATAVMTYDTKGFNSLKIKVCGGTAASTSALYTTLKITESDTVTNASSQTAIVALTGGTATSSSVGFVVPTSAAGANLGGHIVDFQIDLRKRKRYLGLSITPDQTMIYGAVGELHRTEYTRDTVAEKFISNLEATSNTSVVKIVQAL
jgi:hypothetical protein